jgi:hypothetical protein
MSSGQDRSSAESRANSRLPIKSMRLFVFLGEFLLEFARASLRARASDDWEFTTFRYASVSGACSTLANSRLMWVQILGK